MEHEMSAEEILATEKTFPLSKIGEALRIAYASGAAAACALFEMGGYDPEDRDGSFDVLVQASKRYSEQEDDQDAMVLRMMFAYMDCEDAIAKEKEQAERQKIRDEFASKGWGPPDSSLFP